MATLGDEFTTVLAAQSNIDGDNAAILAAQTKLTVDQNSFSVASAHFGQDMQAAGVAALLAPTPNADGTVPVAITDSTQPNGYRIVNAAPATTPVPATPTPAPPAPAPEPES